MSIDAERTEAPVAPRPGLVKSLGIANIAIAALLFAMLLLSIAWLVGATRMRASMTSAPAPMPPSTRVGQVPMVPAMNPMMMGMDDPGFIRFTIFDVVTALAANGVMLASGIGLVNLRRWGASLWTWTAWIKISRLVLVWGFFIVAVAPGFAETLARSVVTMIQSQQIPTGRRATMADYTMLLRVYSIGLLVMGLAVIGLGSIYPAVSLWVMSRRSFRAALTDRGSTSEEIILS